MEAEDVGARVARRRPGLEQFNGRLVNLVGRGDDGGDKRGDPGLRQSLADLPNSARIGSEVVTSAAIDLNVDEPRNNETLLRLRLSLRDFPDVATLQNQSDRCEPDWGEDASIHCKGQNRSSTIGGRGNLASTDRAPSRLDSVCDDSGNDRTGRHQDACQFWDVYR